MSEGSIEGTTKEQNCSLCNKRAEVVFITLTPDGQGGMINQLENSCSGHVVMLKNNIEHGRGLKEGPGYQIKKVEDVYPKIKE